MLEDYLILRVKGDYIVSVLVYVSQRFEYKIREKIDQSK